VKYACKESIFDTVQLFVTCLAVFPYQVASFVDLQSFVVGD